ncbi:MAG TPA: hypothetical protein VJN18_02790 [Polyangiaceae bacterium]|nr:hypothetical protein [Polyangiaceae bacterium]
MRKAMPRRPTRQYRLIADHGCSPVWQRRGRHWLNVDVPTLGISSSLARQLSRWVARFEATYNRRRPEASGFRSAALARAFDEEGQHLAFALEAELGAARVAYLLRGDVARRRRP